MDCSVKPYEGNKDYIFVSYCREDKKYVYPIIEQLARKGYRIWYDSGIHDGEDWLEEIINYHSKCTVFIPFVTNNAILHSHNCRKEIVMAFEDDKKILPVVLEKVELTGVWHWAIDSNQAIQRYKMTYDKMIDRLLNAKVLISCLGEPQPNITISKPSDYDDDPDCVEEVISSNDTVTAQRSTTVEIVSAKDSDEQVVINQNKVVAEIEEDKVVVTDALTSSKTEETKSATAVLDEIVGAYVSSKEENSNIAEAAETVEDTVVLVDETLTPLEKAVKAYADKRYDDALKFANESVLNGETDAEFILACLYLHGLGVDQDQAKAIELFKKISDNHESEMACDATIRLSLCYLRGEGVDKSAEKSVEYLDKAELISSERNKKIKTMENEYSSRKGKLDSDFAALEALMV